LFLIYGLDHTTLHSGPNFKILGSFPDLETSPKTIEENNYI